MSGRKEKLQIFGPAGLEDFIQVQLRISKSNLTYPLIFEVVDTKQSKKIYEDESLEVMSIPLKHRIPTTGYLFKEKARPLNVRPEQLKQYQIPVEAIKKIKSGEDYISKEGQVIANEKLTKAPFLTRSFAYCSDTAYDESIVPLIHGVDLLYHETTFGEDKVEQARKTMHSTAKQAAQIAKLAEVGQLITGHYSSRYADLDILLQEAQSVFKATVLGIEGQTYSVEAQRAEIHY